MRHLEAGGYVAIIVGVVIFLAAVTWKGLSEIIGADTAEAVIAGLIGLIVVVAGIDYISEKF
jgi:K+ transporter